MHARKAIALFVWAWPSGFVTEAVTLGELLHVEVLFGLTGVRKVGDPEDAYSGLDFALPPYLV